MKRWVAASLFGLALVAILLRLFPLVRSPYWGSDFGEYYVLTKGLVERGFVALPYEGWGITYPYFPGLFLFNGAFALAGVPVDAAVVFPTPIVAGLSVLPIFLIAARVTGDDSAALVAAAILAVVMLHVYATSHAIPATLGDFLLLGALLMYVGIRRSPRILVLAVPTALAILVTHHLATYALILAAVGSLLLRAILESGITVRAVRYELAFLAFLMGSTLGYWLTYGSVLWNLILANSPFSAGVLVGGALFLIAIVPIVMWVRKRSAWRFRPRAPSLRSAAIVTTLAFATSFIIVGIAVVATVPGTAIRLTPFHLIVFVPTFALLALSAAGRRVMDLSREGVDATAWFVVLVLSAAIGAAVAPTVLIPYRHVEYLAIPTAIMAGAGARWLSLGKESSVALVATVGVVGILVASSAVVSVPPPSVMAGFDESTSTNSAVAVLWAREHARGLVAGDHRLSSILFGFAGVDATWDRENRFWHEENVTKALDWMRAVRVRDQILRVDWVVVDDNLRAGVQTSPFDSALPLPPGEEEKFMRPPFHKVFDSGSVQVYFLNWGLA